MQSTFIVFLGAGIGGAMRHGVNQACLRYCGGAFPWGTLTVNIAGSLVMGLIVGWLASRSEGGSQALRLFLTTGILGGFTTFSAFSLDVVSLWERGAFLTAITYVGVSVLASIAAVTLGLATMRMLG